MDNKITLKKYVQEFLNDRDKMKKIQQNKNYTSKSLKTEGFGEKTRENRNMPRSLYLSTMVTKYSIKLFYQYLSYIVVCELWFVSVYW